jgi:predicted cobalt transporter CbtA
MELAQQVRLASTKSDVRSYDHWIIIGYAVFALVLMAALYLAGGEPGTSAADLANLTVFP